MDPRLVERSACAFERRVERVLRFREAAADAVELAERRAERNCVVIATFQCERERQSQVADVRVETLEPLHSVPFAELRLRLESQPREPQDVTALQRRTLAP